MNKMTMYMYAPIEGVLIHVHTMCVWLLGWELNATWSDAIHSQHTTNIGIT